METCGNCRFFLPEGNVCRRFPPVPLKQKGENITVFSYFPNMLPQGWCGEFQEVRNEKQ